MNHYIIQKELLKNAERKAARLSSKQYFYYVADNIVYISQGHFVIAIPEKECFVDIGKLAEKTKRIKDIVDTAPKFTAVKTSTYIRNENMGKDLAIFEIKIAEKDGIVIKIDTKYLRYFEKGLRRNERSELTFAGTNAKTPLFIYNYGNFAGLILPVYNGED